MDVNDLRQGVRNGLDDGDFAMSYLWIRFWANGGHACTAEMDAFVHGLQELSDNDVLVMSAVIEELRTT